MPENVLDLLFPGLSAAALALIRTAYGLLLLMTLGMAFRHGRRFFLSERWGGYGQSSRRVDWVQNPWVMPPLALLWIVCAGLLMMGKAVLFAAIVNVVLCWYFFVAMRWKGALRGMGAPGFMTWWLGFAVLLLELAQAFAPELIPLAVFVLQVDFALVMLSAGIYKVTSGYPRNAGMQYGLANPEWGYWWKRYSRLRPGHWFFRFCNHSAWIVQIGAALLMLIPPTRMLGAVLIMASFAFVATQIRLGVLCQMVVVAGLLFFPPGSAGDAVMAGLVREDLVRPASMMLADFPGFPLAGSRWGGVRGGTTGLAVCLASYLILLPVSYAGLYYNFYCRRSLSPWLQRALDGYTNFFGIILWRVFSADHTNFYVLIHREDQSGKRELLSHYDRIGSRHNHVGEAIVVKCLFTTLKYYPSDSRQFAQRLLRYARTLPCPEDSRLVFEYVSLRDGENGFRHVRVAEFLVDPVSCSVTEHPVEDAVCMRRPSKHSPVFEGMRPGSYVALKG